jgi:lipopolysaccharide exporter
MTTVRKSIAFSVAQRYGQIALSLAGNMVLARLLSPEQIGIYSVSVAVLAVVQVLRDFGIGSFLIQEKRLEQAHVQTAFGLSLIVGALLFTILFAAAPAVAGFYGEPQLIGTLRISALNFLILPFCTISMSLMSRDMRFDRIALITLAATVLGLATTLVTAYQGFGPNSMAIGGVVTNLAMGIGAWVANGRQRLVRPALSQWRSVLRFGGRSAVTGVVTSVSTDINDLVSSKILGFAAVAYLSRAMGLMYLFHRDLMAALRSVAYASFARTIREGGAVEADYRRAVAGVTVVAWPFYGFAALYALELLRLLFGPQWDIAASLVPIYCAAGAIAALTNLTFTVVMAEGRIDLITRFEVIFQPLRAALVVAAVWWFRSLEAAALAYVLATIIYTPLAYRVKGRCLPTDWPALLRSWRISLAVAALTLAAPALIAAWTGFDRQEPMHPGLVVLAGASAVVAWLLAIRWTSHEFANDPLYQRGMAIVARPFRRAG